MTNVVIIGGGPGGYEAALVASQLGAYVTLIERDGIGGAAVLTDVVPSKALIAVAEAAIDTKGSSAIGVHATDVTIDIADVNARLKKWAATQSSDIQQRLLSQGVKVLAGTAELIDAENVKAKLSDGTEITLKAEVVLLATGARPRELTSAVVDGDRILNWKQLYEFTELPSELIVVGSGVTGVYAGIGLGSWAFAGTMALGAAAAAKTSISKSIKMGDSDSFDAQYLLKVVAMVPHPVETVW